MNGMNNFRIKRINLDRNYVFEVYIFSGIIFYNITPKLDVALITWWHALIPADKMIDDFTRIAIKSFIWGWCHGTTGLLANVLW